MTQIVTVTRVSRDGATAEISMQRMPACAHDCSKCSGCIAPAGLVTATALNPVGAAEGDSVVVESRTGTVLAIAALTYLMPVSLFFIGYALGGVIGERFQVPAAFLAFIAGLAALLPLNRLVKRKSAVLYTIISIAG